MKISTWLFIIGGAWIVYEKIGESQTSGGPLTALMPTLSNIDTMLPGGASLPIAAGGAYLVGIGAILRFGFSK